MTRRWRPPLVLVVMGALGGTLFAPTLGLIALRYLGPDIGFRAAAVLSLAGIGAATLIIAWLFARLLVRPMQALEAYVVSVVRREAAQPPAHFGTQELHRTARSVIDMARTLQDREATVRTYTQHVTHELRTPVSAIRAASELLADGMVEPTDRRLLADIDGARAQLEAQLAALSEAARAREARFTGHCQLGDVVDNLRKAHPALVLEPSGLTTAFPIAAEGLMIILHQLLRNAAEHGAGRVELSASGHELVVTDDGPGVSPGHADRIFDPFFTSKRAEGGTGMGLAIARNVAAAHRGRLSHVPGAGGACFVLSFAGAEIPRDGARIGS